MRTSCVIFLTFLLVAPTTLSAQDNDPAELLDLRQAGETTPQKTPPATTSTSRIMTVRVTIADIDDYMEFKGIKDRIRKIDGVISFMPASEIPRLLIWDLVYAGATETLIQKMNEAAGTSLKAVPKIMDDGAVEIYLTSV